MDEKTQQEHGTEQVQPRDAPVNWTDAQNSVAAATGLAILLVEGFQPPALAISNNNLICHAFQSSATHAHLCAPYCGKAFDRAQAAGEPVHYRCHAGLHCIAMPVELVEKRRLAVIGGRAFLTTADYRALAERFRVGDLQDMLSSDLFSNVIFAARQDLSDLASRVSAAANEYRNQSLELPARRAPVPESSGLPAQDQEELSIVVSNEVVPLLEPIDKACRSAMRALAKQYKIGSLALLLRSEGGFEAAFVTGKFATHSVRLPMRPEEGRLLEAARLETSVVIPEPAATGETAAGSKTTQRSSVKQPRELFPLLVGDEVKGALLVADTVLDSEKRQAIYKFCQELALPLEVIHLRDELDKHMRGLDSLHSFTNRINITEPGQTYFSILRHSAELLRAERSSLQLFDEASNELSVKVAFGPRADIASTARVRLGDGVSGAVLLDGRPRVVRNLETEGREPAPAERLYKTKSYISYPISIGMRKVGVLNLTDKIDGGSYDEFDLGLIETLAPQMALALDRAEWQEKAAQFQLMSITDPLTGLLNRRYLEERLAEELKRSERQNYAMGFMMIDIDDFKYYNDHNGHQAGDLALEMTAQCLRSVLRAADVASRYGGEEFCILLPQTKLDEANAIAERIRRRVERTRFPHGKTQPLGTVTVSIGISGLDETLTTPAAIIGAADRALYLAKRLGKNRVQVLDNAPTDDLIPDADENNR